MRSLACPLLLVTLFVPWTAGAQRHAASGVVSLTLDVIGPRTTASIRTALRSHERELDACRGESDGLVRLAIAIAPDGALFSVTPIDDPDLDADATECVAQLARGWRFPRTATSTTTVAWSFRLRAEETRTCWCFSWVHGPDHGRDCATTAALCEQGRERRGPSGETTECTSSVQPTCERDGYVGGQHVHLP